MTPLHHSLEGGAVLGFRSPTQGGDFDPFPRRISMSRRAILLSLLAASLPLSATAFALPTGRNFTVRVEGNNVGTIQARNRVVDEGDSCIYTLMWTLHTPPLDRTVRCDIRE